MKALVCLVALVASGCSFLTRRPTPADTLPKEAPAVELAAVLPGDTVGNSYVEDMRKNANASRMIQVFDAGAFGPSFLFTLVDSELTFQSSGEHGLRIESQRLSPKVAAATWAEIGRLNISGWRRSYSPKDFGPEFWVFDGTQWSVTLRDASKRAYSFGNNVYPAMKPFGTPVLGTPQDANAYGQLLSLFMKITADAGIDIFGSKPRK